MNLPDQLSASSQVPLFIMFIWSIAWKGLALWRAAKQEQRNWFIAMLVLNTVGILEIVYLFRFSKKKLTFKELQFWNKH